MTLIEAPGNRPSSSSSSRLAITGEGLPLAIDGHPILSQLGAGGMGAVYLAYDALMDREVALKLLLPSPTESHRAKHTARFLSEAVLTGKLGHAGIVPIYKVGFDERFGYYYTMRYVKGRTLANIERAIQEYDPRATEQYTLMRLLTMFLRACEAVAFAHRHNVVHRDLKPANIIAADFGEVLVLDWGLAKDVDASKTAVDAELGEEASKLAELRQRHDVAKQIFLSQERQRTSQTTYLRRLQAIRPVDRSKQKITDAAQILGTPGYLSPEQGEGRSVTPASDVYSLGATLYELLMHALPVPGETSEERILNTITGKVIPLQSRPEAARLPKVLCEMIGRALSFKPEDRYQNAGELVEELTLYLEGRSAWRQLVPAAPPAAAAVPPPNLEPWQVLAGNVTSSAEGLLITRGTRMHCTSRPLGDFRGQFEFWAQGENGQWSVELRLYEVEAEQAADPRYCLRLGVGERPFIELLRRDKRVQRRLDLRLQSGRWYTVKFELEQEALRMWLGNRKYIEYHEVFPQTGGALEIAVPQGFVGLQKFSMQSRGAPLRLSFMALPDRLFRDGKYAEAREFYRRLAGSHPDREEGLGARYKAGLCSTLMKDSDDAFQEFTRLENTMYDHCCALGFAELGMLDGNIDWAWEALKNGYRRHQEQDVRSELWFGLLNMIEHLPNERHAEKIARYGELLGDIRAAPEESGRVACELLDLLQEHRSSVETRREAARLLEAYAGNVFVAQEALFAYAKIGLDESALPVVTPALDSLIKFLGPDPAAAALHVLRAEIDVAAGDSERAQDRLKDAVSLAGIGSPDGLWARQWQILLSLLAGQHQQAMLQLHETLSRLQQLRPAQLGYFRILEALAYWYRGKATNATTSLRKAAETDSLWGRAAHHWAVRQPASLLPSALIARNTTKFAEASFLIGEIHRLTGQPQLACDHFRFCLEPLHERAMFTHLAKQRLAQILGVASASAPARTPTPPASAG
jgi:serine/threonine protein kinase